uniref:Coat protein n=1 Tax=Paris polyphylla virus X TaxID=388066 RepID=Q19AW6_9VIRU|nr:coat protein [Paris polyphylla virus X]
MSATSSSDPTKAPSMKEVLKLIYSPTTATVATPAEIITIAKVWVDVDKVPANLVPSACWDLARAFADIGASSKSELNGDTPALAGLSRRKLAQSIRAICSIRQFCMYFASIVWNILIDTGTPPASWVRLGYTEETRFAAFDFFEGVGHPAALMPAEGLIREPSALERTAHATNKRVALHRDRAARGNAVSDAVEITQGRTARVTPLITHPDV